MHHLRHIIQLLIVAICLFWGGLQLTAEVFAQQADRAGVLSDSDTDIEDQYPDLPVEVARSIRSVVATQQLLNDATNQGQVASGVVINDQQVITAGHAMGGGSLMCVNTNVVASGLVSKATASSDPVTHAAFQYTPGIDLAVMTLRASDNFRNLPDVKLAAEQPQKGETVYFINFQPTADGHIRNPAAETKPGDVDYTKPAIFSGVVAQSKKDRVTIATGYSKSYGLGPADSMVRKGASGGAIVNVRGELVGLSVASESLQATHNAASLAVKYGIGVPSNFHYQLAYIQPVSQGLIDNLQTTTISCGE
jgi:hypothetical protein